MDENEPSTDPLDDEIRELQEQLPGLQGKARQLIEAGLAELLHQREIRIQTDGGAAVNGSVDTGGGDFTGRDKIEIVVNEGGKVVIGEQPVAMSAGLRRTALGRYLEHIIAHNRYLQLQGIRSGGRLVNIELERIYITLRTVQQATPQAEGDWLADEAGAAPGEERRRAMLARPPAAETQALKIEQALAAHRHLVVLGDPGSGKTTLLRYLALLYARDLAQGGRAVPEKLGLEETGYLPILLPLRQVGAFLRARYPQEAGLDGYALLLEFLRQHFENQRIALPGDFFDEYLQAGRALVLLDGLDEVADPGLRARVAYLVESFSLACPACRFVVTSRVVGYSGPARLGAAFRTATVRDFSLEDVRRFLEHWHLLVAAGQMGAGAEAERYAESQTEQLMQAIQSNERIAELAINPLMLTVIALVHRDRVKLPDRRAELYAEAVDVLLGKWDEARGVGELPILENRPFDAGDKRLLLQSVALYMHAKQQKEIAAEDLRRLLADKFIEMLPDRRGVRQAVERFTRVIEERTGLLAARGQGVYAFSHLTFQEYLAALAAAGRDDYVDYTLGRSGEAWWREVILLEAGYLSMQSQARTARLVRAIAEHKEEPQPCHNLVLASDCLRDVGAGRAGGELEGEVQQALQRRFRRELQAARRAPVWLGRAFKGVTRDWIERRGAVVQALARAGAGYWSGPYGEPEWVRIPAGEFWMGSEGPDALKSEKPLHRVYLPEYWMACTPVSNAQYALFVQAAGHPLPEGWESHRPPKGREAHPVVNVSWRDALAYCRWLGQVTGKPVALPSEAEWEKAARGDKDRREYPWGNDFDSQRCNTSELDLGDTTPVGVFLEGASPYGLLDMIGNVWEWVSSLAWAYPYNLYDGREDLDAPVLNDRILRGGGWGDDCRYARCADRGKNVLTYSSDRVGFRVRFTS